MIRLSIRRPVAVSMAYVAVALLGVAAWRNIPIELLPDPDLPRLTVFAVWRGASPETVEAFLTSPMEAEIQQVRGVERVQSWSEERDGMGQSRIQVEFARGTEMDFARLEMSERLATLEPDLPQDVEGPFIQQYVPEEFRDQDRPFLGYTVTGPHTLEALRAHIDDRIRPDLLQLDGVAEVIALGGRERLLEVELDERRIRALGLAVEQIRGLIADLDYVSEAGMIEKGGRRLSLAIRHHAATAADVLRLPLLNDRGRLVRVADVARVHDTFEEATNHYRIDGQPAVAFEVHRAPRTNAVAVADRVKRSIGQLAASHPPGVRLILDNDESEAIRLQLTDLRYRALVAAGVVFAVLLLFLRSFRAAGIVFATIAFSILIALNLIYFGGLTLNLLTLMGLAMGFGLIVDNAIVVLENIHRHRRAGAAPAMAAERGASQVLLPILAATLTTLIVFIPFVYLQGELRVYYVPLAIVVGLALFASLFVAFSFVPSLAARVFARDRVTRADPDAVPLYQAAYQGLVGISLRFPWLAVLVAGGALYGSYRLFDTYVQRGVLWRNWWAEQTYIDVSVRQARGAELERTDELVRYFEERIAAMPEVERFVTRVNPQWANVRVTFPDSLEHTLVPVAIKEQLTAFSLLFGGAEVRVIGYGPSFYGGGASPPNYSVKVLGYNYETVRDLAEDLGARLRRMPRVRDIDVNSMGRWFDRDKATEFVLELDRPRLAMHGLTARDVVQLVRAAAGGQGGDVMRLGGEELRYTVKIAGYHQLDALALQELLLPAPDGEEVRLADVGRLVQRDVLARVVREDQQYQRIVSYEFRGPTKLGDAVQEAAIGATHLPDGYTLEAGEEFRWSVDEERQIYGVLAISLVLIFMVTAALFESMRQPFCVLLAVPMALVGVFLIFFYTGASFTREAYIGVIMMGGIVVNNAILLVDHINRVRRRDGLALREAIVRGTIERVRPILMTSATTIFGLLPLVLFSEAADANIWNALGFALIGGLASSTLFVLTVTPALYLLIERGPERRRLEAVTAHS